MIRANLCDFTYDTCTAGRKMDCWLLPFMSIMYFFNAVDRVSCFM